ncbi:SDR family NAD(P)-dependent oxidoreductase [Verminephrobacter aporrectodeae]|uniref:SDR family NAD(P)-dependent oxidoreductase n=1 Tax=Verminephrobacter aporrectodeae TaxID=1110389 RepID=UPI002238B2CA|nr:SDR family NAD(P)-dependent oxidoreductase [Verminephrobacter aporrectodeae]MCW5220719.1 SDR family NAD(P)-dependent oxidoreductase [Verminephrobacter aporrectodeae subsp. tuberculatae]MCW5290014.1 SDR family NAD(P)-dependent oxidoreductase [Verminephrobacter aporrectodeae subsp. tuberculatae]MCW8175507.1 SDR family NAD(P)-dependent oxidoreductase [Verminephrobacter aporrectodeae subsp. tuberculatae]MCW8202992.1 SDR family NAD(P)-dependent oxidoreductase [Verminephrobacter aporrectodeae subs
MPHHSHLHILTGASRGLGLALARQLLRSGNTVICIARSANAELDAQARTAGATIEQWQHDLAQGERAAQRLATWLAAQDPANFASATLINNAGLIPRIAPLSGSDCADLARALRVGLEAPMQLTAAFLGATDAWTLPRKVLNVSSGLGRRAMASQAAYCAAKAGMDHFSRCVALDEALKPHGAKICALAPGVIDTGMQEQLRSAMPEAFPDHQNFTRLQTEGRLASPADAAARVLAWLERADFGAQPVADVRDA